jgi:hypothetical protein
MVFKSETTTVLQIINCSFKDCVNLVGNAEGLINLKFSDIHMNDSSFNNCSTGGSGGVNNDGLFFLTIVIYYYFIHYINLLGTFFFFFIFFIFIFLCRRCSFA